MNELKLNEVGFWGPCMLKISSFFLIIYIYIGLRCAQIITIMIIKVKAISFASVNLPVIKQPLYAISSISSLGFGKQTVPTFVLIMTGSFNMIRAISLSTVLLL